MGKFKDITNFNFGEWTVLEYLGNSNWKCKCSCGNERVLKTGTLNSGKSKSCGCKLIKHGQEGTKVYRLWTYIKERCYSENHKSYNYYGGRGIKVCNEWLESKNFIEWAFKNGYKEGLTIDRIDVNGDYEPNNCRFITNKEQQRNKRNNVFITIEGITKTISEWAEISNLGRNTVRERFKKGISGIELLKPGRKGGGLDGADFEKKFNLPCKDRKK